MLIKVTDRAVKELLQTIKGHRENDPTLSEEIYVRLSIKGGGCSGYQHLLALEEGKLEGDEIYSVSDINFIVDKRSALYLEGVEVDFVNEINRMGFKITNSLAKSTCGCGSSVSF